MSYKVQSGDSLSSIARSNGLSLAALEQANPQLHNPNVIHVGQVLNLPGKADTFKSAPALPVPSQNLAVGSKGSAVQQLQTDLVHLGFLSQADMSTGPGTYGSHTAAAVAKLQARYGISGDGGAHFGPQTRAALARALGSTTAPPSSTPPSSTPPKTNPAPSTGGSAADQKRAQALQFAIDQANDPNVGYSQTKGRLGQSHGGGPRYYDCSGLVYEAYKSVGVTLGASDTRGMWASWRSWATQVPKDFSQMKPGDLVLINSSSPEEHHVLMYMGNGKCVAAATGNTSWAQQVRTGDSAQSYFDKYGSRCIVLRPKV